MYFYKFHAACERPIDPITQTDFKYKIGCSLDTLLHFINENAQCRHR